MNDTKVCPRCGHDMHLATLSTVFSRRTVIEVGYTCPRCRMRIVFEWVEVRRDGDKILVRRAIRRNLS